MKTKEEIFNEPMKEFSQHISKLNFYHKHSKDLLSSKIEHLSKQKEFLNKNNQDDFNMGCHFMMKSPFDGEFQYLGTEENNTDERIETSIYYHNKECQWLLVEAYESFEAYLNNLYAVVGYINNSFWNMSDFGSISINEINDKDLNWFHGQVILKPKKPDSILNQFRNKINKIKDFEKENKLQIDLYFYLYLISSLRHIIVHNKGNVSNKEKFIEKVFKQIGLYNNGKYDEKYLSIINIHFGDNKYENTINLSTTQYKKDNSPLSYNYDRLEILLRNMGSYVFLINRLVFEYIEEIQ